MNPKIKVGQTVRYMGSNLKKRQGMLATVEALDPIKVLWEDGSEGCPVIHNLAIIHRSEEDNMNEILPDKQNSQTKWNFFANRVSDIKWEEIQKDLSWSNPLALVQIQAKEDERATLCVVVYAPLIVKADWCNKRIQNYAPGVSWFDRNIIEFSDMTYINGIKEWAKDVKAKSWPDTIKADVTVHLLKV